MLLSSRRFNKTSKSCGVLWSGRFLRGTTRVQWNKQMSCWRCAGEAPWRRWQIRKATKIGLGAVNGTRGAFPPKREIGAEGMHTSDYWGAGEQCDWNCVQENQSRSHVCNTFGPGKPWNSPPDCVSSRVLSVLVYKIYLFVLSMFRLSWAHLCSWEKYVMTNVLGVSNSHWVAWESMVGNIFTSLIEGQLPEVIWCSCWDNTARDFAAA